ncbi:MAG: hypothetical protein N2C14_02190, partial [Planctomycetales bacterium]
MLTNGPNLRDRVVIATERLAAGREKLRKRHAKHSPGVQVCNAVTDLIDHVILELYESALRDLDDDSGELRSNIALVAHGGYGRRDMAPFSDVDLMILHTPAVADRISGIAGRMLRDVGDSGLSVGHSVRTPSQAISLGIKDPVIGTSLMESRLLAGDEAFFKGFLRRYRRKAQGCFKRLLAAIGESRDQERSHYGETVHLLEPNVKRSQGGLRDVHLLRWIGFARHGTPDPERLRMMGAVDDDDYRKFRAAHEFLLRLRNDMHFRSGRAHDLLDRAEQLRVAEAFGFEGDAGALPVERFMQEYFRHTRAVSGL